MIRHVTFGYLISTMSSCVSSLDFSAFCVVNYLRPSFYYSLVLFVCLCILCAAVMRDK